MKKYLFLFFLIPSIGWTQDVNYTKIEDIDKTRYENTDFYNVKDYTKKKGKENEVKNIIFLIGDGM